MYRCLEDLYLQHGGEEADLTDDVILVEEDLVSKYTHQQYRTSPVPQGDVESGAQQPGDVLVMGAVDLVLGPVPICGSPGTPDNGD